MGVVAIEMPLYETFGFVFEDGGRSGVMPGMYHDVCLHFTWGGCF